MSTESKIIIKKNIFKPKLSNVIKTKLKQQNRKLKKEVILKYWTISNFSFPTEIFLRNEEKQMNVHQNPQRV